MKKGCSSIKNGCPGFQKGVSGYQEGVSGYQNGVSLDPCPKVKQIEMENSLAARLGIIAQSKI